MTAGNSRTQPYGHFSGLRGAAVQVASCYLWCLEKLFIIPDAEE